MMRQRLISAAIGIPLAIVVLFFYQTPLLNIAIALVTLLAVYEILVATKYLKNWGLAAICFTRSTCRLPTCFMCIIWRRRAAFCSC